MYIYTDTDLCFDRFLFHPKRCAMLWRFTATWIGWIPTHHAGRDGRGVERTVHQQFWSAKPETWPPEWRSFSGFWQRSNWTWRFWTDEVQTWGVSRGREGKGEMLIWVIFVALPG